MTPNDLINFVREIYRTDSLIPLHSPIFAGKEKEYVNQTLDTTFVSSVGRYVDKFESLVENFTGIPKAVATVNGTSALHASLYLTGVKPGDFVITQALSFVATCNAISQAGASPIFCDISSDTLYLCHKSAVLLTSIVDVDKMLVFIELQVGE